MLSDLHIGFSRGRSGGLVFPSLSEYSTVFAIHTVKGFGIVNKAEIDVFLGFTCFFYDPEDVAEKAMATHSNTLAWKISWMEEPGRLQSMGSLGVGHD